MVERKQFKTKPCILYQKGRCTRHPCTFAHGDAELRRFSGSFNARRGYKGSDLRDKLDRRRASPRRYSPPRNSRGRHATREYSSSRSFERKSDKKHQKKHVNDHSDISGSLKVSNGIQDQANEGKVPPSDSADAIEEQLKKVQLDIHMLEQQKSQFGIYLEERAQEVNTLNSRIQELEVQLSKENEEYKRITSKIRKFVRAHNRTSKIQDELKRSQARLQRLGIELAADVTRITANEEDLSIDIVNNGETTCLPLNIRHSDEQNDAFLHKKRLHNESDSVEIKQDQEKGGQVAETVKLKKRSRWSVPTPVDSDDVIVGHEAGNNRSHVLNPPAYEANHKKGYSRSANKPPSDKLKGLVSHTAMPSTSMAAHAVDEEVENEKYDMVETTSMGMEKDDGYNVKKSITLLPPPPLPHHSKYSLYEGDDVKVNVDDGLDDDEEAVHVDID